MTACSGRRGMAAAAAAGGSAWLSLCRFAGLAGLLLGICSRARPARFINPARLGADVVNFARSGDYTQRRSRGRLVGRAPARFSLSFVLPEACWNGFLSLLFAAVFIGGNG